MQYNKQIWISRFTTGNNGFKIQFCTHMFVYVSLYVILYTKQLNVSLIVILFIFTEIICDFVNVSE